MKVLLYWNCIYLPYSEYMLRHFSKNDFITELVVVGPQNIESHPVYQGEQAKSKIENLYPNTVFYKTSTYRKKWTKLFEFYKIIKKHRPDLIIILDEALSVNVFNAALANWLVRNPAYVLFYGFENLYQGIPWAYLKSEHFKFKAIKEFLRKTIRYLFFDLGLHPVRRRLVYGGLTSYKECQDILLMYKWKPRIKNQWWGIDLEPFFAEISEEDLSRLRSFHGIPHDAKVLGYVGRFSKEKGVLDLLQALESLDGLFYLILIGCGELQKDISIFIEEHNLKNRVICLSPMGHHLLASYYKIMNLLVLPSRTSFFWKEQYGRVLVEAMAAGTPAIGSNSGAIPYVIGNQRRIFQEGNVKEMVEKIKEFFALKLECDHNQLKVQAEQGNITHFIESYLSFVKG